MSRPNCWSIGRVVALIVAVLLVATPASAQFGALKKKLKGQAVEKGVDKAVDAAAGDVPAAANAPTETGAAAGPAGGTLVLTPELLDRFMAGLKAREAERVAARKENTPYMNYLRAKAAYDTAKTKCQAAQQTGITKLAADEKKMAKYQAYMDKMVAAQQKQDPKSAAIYVDSAMGMIDQSCTVHEPVQPANLYDNQREVDDRAEQAALKTAGLSAREFGLTADAVTAILTGNAPATNTSPSEKAAVQAKSAELKDLMGLRAAQEERLSKPAPTPAPAVVDTAPPPTAVQGPAMPMGAAAISDCQVKNIEKHQKEIDALGDRGSAAQEAGDTALMMAIADTINRIRMAGCMKGQ